MDSDRVKIEQCPDDLGWNLCVDGRLEIREETFAVCDRVRDALVGLGASCWEIQEVADGIRDRHV